MSDMDLGQGIVVCLPEYLDDEGFPEDIGVGSRLDWDIEVWDASWQPVDRHSPIARSVGKRADGFPTTSLIGQAHLYQRGWFVTSGRLWFRVQAVDLGESRPAEGEWVEVRGVLGLPPTYVMDEEFDPARRQSGIVGYPTPQDDWVVVELSEPALGGWARLVRSETAGTAATQY